MTEKSRITEALFAKAGPKLEAEIRNNIKGISMSNENNGYGYQFKYDTVFKYYLYVSITYEPEKLLVMQQKFNIIEMRACLNYI